MNTVHDLGVISNSKLTIQGHVTKLFYLLWQLRTPRQSLTFGTRRTLATAFIVSWVDYCNAVVPSLSRWSWMPQLVCSSARASSMTSCRLYWLLVMQRIKYKLKMVTLTFNNIHSTEPSYYIAVCVPVCLSCWLRPTCSQLTEATWFLTCTWTTSIGRKASHFLLL